MAGAWLPPLDSFVVGYRLQGLNSPVGGVVEHFLEDLVCLAHTVNDTVYSIIIK